MTKYLRLASLAVVAALALGACSDFDAYDAAEPVGGESSSDLDAAAADLGLDIAWNDMTASEQSDMCDSVDLLGIDASYEAFVSGFENTVPPTFDQFAAHFAEECP